MTSTVAKMSQFEWSEAKSNAARGLADGKTQQQVADECGINRKTVQRWLQDPEFSYAVDELTILTGISLRAERLRITKRIIRQMVKDDQEIKTEKDVLEWLKYAQAETNGSDILEQLVASIANRQP